MSFLLQVAVLVARFVFGEQQMPLMLHENQVLRCYMENKTVAHQLHEWAQTNNVDIWQNERFRPDQPVDFMVQSHKEAEAVVSETGALCEQWISGGDLVSLLHQHEDAQMTTTDSNPYEAYQPHATLMKLLMQYCDASDICYHEVIGKSVEGRDLVIARLISTSVHEQNNKKKPMLWLSGGIHAREFISSHAALYLLKQFTEQSSNDNLVRKMLNDYEIVILVHINPDGYEHARTHSRLWRKNRSTNKDGSRGVDLNRNFDIYFGQGGSSRNPASDTYMGTRAGSEPETKAIQDFMQRELHQLNRTMAAGVDLHSYGQLILRPYGFTQDPHPEEARNKRIGDAVRDAMAVNGGARYTSQTSAGLYAVTGAFDDYITVKCDTLGFTWELRDRGRYGFLLPADQILPTAQEVWRGVRELGKQLLQEL